MIEQRRTVNIEQGQVLTRRAERKRGVEPLIPNVIVGPDQQIPHRRNDRTSGNLPLGGTIRILGQIQVILALGVPLAHAVRGHQLVDHDDRTGAVLKHRAVTEGGICLPRRAQGNRQHQHERNRLGIADHIRSLLQTEILSDSDKSEAFVRIRCLRKFPLHASPMAGTSHTHRPSTHPRQASAFHPS